MPFTLLTVSYHYEPEGVSETNKRNKKYSTATIALSRFLYELAHHVWGSSLHLKASLLSAIVSMCFTWEAADGYGPIWIFGDQPYVDAKEEFNSRNGKIAVRKRAISTPYWTKKEETEIIEVETKNIDTKKYAVPDKSPVPPPSYFTWEHLYKREEKNLYPHGVLCEQIAQMWARRFGWPPTPGLAAPEICVLWMLEGDDGDRHVYKILAKTASKIVKLRKASYGSTVSWVGLIVGIEFGITETVLILEALDALSVRDNMKNIQRMKRICAFCHELMGKTWRCKSCSCRYCSESCQSKHWNAGHKLECPGIKSSSSRTSLSTTCTISSSGLYPTEEEDSL